MIKFNPDEVVAALRGPLEAVDKMPPPPKLPEPRLSAPVGKIECACSSKFMDAQEMEFHQTRHLQGVTDTMCRECRQRERGKAYLVCKRCKAVVGRWPPFRTKSGFEIKAEAFYHLSGCPKCCGPDVLVSVLIEKLVFDKLNGLPIDPRIRNGLIRREIDESS